MLDLIEQAQEKAQNDWLPFGLISSLRQISKATQDFYSMMTIAQIRNYADMSDRFLQRGDGLSQHLGTPASRTATASCSP